VITSNVSSMPEVGGDAAVYVDPSSIEDIKEKVDLVMNDKSLRKEMIEKGFEWVKQFSWEKAAKQTADIYRKLANG
ncbi:MAG: glycosyltransferase family 1 protein, partial [Candidatus Daviesbacteria bacterium]|nr:glycosyltransferase family 1 protein [Candidatus Daviesbacteria bacterium]